MKQEVLCKSTLHYPTGSELLTHDHNPDLNRSISEYAFRVIAPPTDQCEHYIVITLSNWNKIAHATSERLLQQIYESVCNNSDGATYWQQEVKSLSLPQCAKRAWRGDLRLVIDRSLPDRNRLRRASSPRTASASGPSVLQRSPSYYYYYSSRQMNWVFDWFCMDKNVPNFAVN